MTKEKALEELRALTNVHDLESAHMRADDILLELINDPEITKAFEDLDKWYA